MKFVIGLCLSVLIAATATAQTPRVLTLTASETHVAQGQRITLSWTSEYTESVMIVPIQQYLHVPNGSYDVTVEKTTTFAVYPYPYWNERKEVTVYVDQAIAIQDFYASAELIGTYDEVTLYWHVLGATSVSIDGTGGLPLQGSMIRLPAYTQTYTLRAAKGSDVRTASVTVEVSDEWQRSRFVLSYERDRITTTPPVDFAAYQPINVFVLGQSLDGRGLAGVEFGVDLTPQLVISSADFFSTRAVNVLSAPDYVVGLGLCVQTMQLHPLAQLTVIGMDRDAVVNGRVRLRPAAIQSIPGTVAYATCDIELNGSELSGPLLDALTGPDLFLSLDRVPVLTLELHAERNRSGVALLWDPVTGAAVDRLEITRRVGAGRAELLRRFDAGDLAMQSNWMDLDAPVDATLRYELSAWAGEERLAASAVDLSPAVHLPGRSGLMAAAPNPFNPRTELQWMAAVPGDYELGIYDAAGRAVRSFRFSGLAAGRQETAWDGHDDAGERAASGVYYVQLRGPDGVDQLRVVMLK